MLVKAPSVLKKEPDVCGGTARFGGIQKGLKNGGVDVCPVFKLICIRESS